MIYLPINGLRLLAIEAGVLLFAAILSYLFFRFLRQPLPRPRWCEAVLTHNGRAVLLVIAAALIGRALVFFWVGIPQPRVDDEYSYLLMGDTFAHFRLTNPTPADWRHFETFHVNLTPSYHSKYPVSQGLSLAFGEIVFHQPWMGVYLSTALLCGAICWTLQAIVPPGWALLGALLAAFRLALFSYWMNSYWGGSVAALGGALALGSAIRLFGARRPERRQWLLASLFALSLLILATSRPYEGLGFSLPLLVYFAYKLIQGLQHGNLTLRSTLVPVLLIGIFGTSLMAYYNERTTGSPLLLPHLLNERVYSPLPLFLWQKPKAALVFHDPVFKKFFEVTQQEYRYDKTNSLPGIFELEIARLASNWFFYIGVALSFPVLIGAFSIWNERRQRIVLFVAASTAVAVALCIYTMFHYAAPATVTVYIFAAEGLRYLWEQKAIGERSFVVAVCLTVVITSLMRETGSTAMNSTFATPDTRGLITRQLEKLPGKQLVLVSYDLAHHYPGDELVHNWADFGSEKILWARSKGAGNDGDLCGAYRDRTFWSVTTDDVSYTLRPIDLCRNTIKTAAANP